VSNTSLEASSTALSYTLILNAIFKLYNWPY
jgi:hypothetical protein